MKKLPYTIYQRGSRFYYRVYDAAGKRRTCTVEGKNEEDARKNCEDLLKQNRLLPIEKMCFADFVHLIYASKVVFEGWNIEKSQHYITPSQMEDFKTAEGFKTIVGTKLLPFWGTVSLKEIPQILPQWVSFLRKEDVHPISAAIYNQCLLHILSILRKERRSFMKCIPAIEWMEPQEQRGVLTEKEITAVLSTQAIDTVWQGNESAWFILFLSFLTGIRVGEIPKLKNIALKVTTKDEKVYSVIQHCREIKDDVSTDVPISQELLKYFSLFGNVINRYSSAPLFRIQSIETMEKEVFQRIGLTVWEIERRGLSFSSFLEPINETLKKAHSWKKIIEFQNVHIKKFTQGEQESAVT